MLFFSANIILVGYQEEDSSFSINDQVIMAKDRSATAYFLHTCKATLTCHHLINWHDNVSYISTFSRCKWRIHLDWSFWLVRNRNSLTALFLNSKKLQSYVAHTGTATSGGLITCDIINNHLTIDYFLDFKINDRLSWQYSQWRLCL